MNELRKASLVLTIALLASGCAAGATDDDTESSSPFETSEEEARARQPARAPSTVETGARPSMETLAVPSRENCGACRPGPIPWQDLHVPPPRDEN